MDADDETPDAAQRLAAILDAATAAADTDVQVLALDAQAGIESRAGNRSVALELLARADEVMGSAGHRIAEHDRIDARRAHALVGAGSDPSAG